MNWKGLVNWLLSGAAAFVAGFFTVPLFVDGVPIKSQLAMGAAAGLSYMVAHLRNNPLKWSADPPNTQEAP